MPLSHRQSSEIENTVEERDRTEPEFVNVYEAQESIPLFSGFLKRLQIRALVKRN
jgi:hypothetical protein